MEEDGKIKPAVWEKSMFHIYTYRSRLKPNNQGKRYMIFDMLKE
ncbi:hypothetical protein QY95_02208 [Bacillus thermotolerans]|uniref:Uncharacterized protein n=1 Tax=Bacillus thermotolerans TaxID=1221996 RepID=A0A0F5I2A6_BACTR|nr:hypothetical protein QY95_02208 [Bacillus thermotolerans]